MSTVYSNGELRFFRLTKCVVDHATEALRIAFKQEWNYLHTSSPWQNDRTSGSLLLAEEKPSSRLLDPAYSKDYQHIKDKLSRGNLEDWDVTVLFFALKYSHALSRIRYGFHWRRIESAIYRIKGVRNVLFSHASEAYVSQYTFERNVDILVQAVEDLLSSSDPLVEELQKLRNETEFATEDLLRYKQLVKDDHTDFLLLEESIKRLEDKLGTKATSQTVCETAESAEGSSEISNNSEIVSKMCCRMDKLERQIATAVDLVPSRSKPAILRRAKYIRLMNKSFYMSCNFRWGELEKLLQEFNDDSDTDLKIFAGIQSAVGLNLQSKKKEALDVLNSLLHETSEAPHGVVLRARIKICKAYILHDQGKDDEAMEQADDAGAMLDLRECHEDLGELNNIKANIILSASKNGAEDRERILCHLDRSIHSCEKATVDRSVTIVQAKIRKALLHLGYYQHGILEEVPPSDIDIAQTILKRVSEQCEPLSKRSKVYFTYGESLLAHRKGDTRVAGKLEHKVRKKCEKHEFGFEIQQLDILRTLIRGASL